MFDNLREKISGVLAPLRSRQLSESNIEEAVREVRNALIDADVAFNVVTEFVQDVQRQAVGQTISRSVQPGHAFVRIVHDSLVKLMGETADGLDLGGGNVPNVVLMAGLQGVGKTTTAVKLAKWLKERDSKSVSVVSADVYRPAAIEQLQSLAEQADVEFIPSKQRDRPDAIVKRAVKLARKSFHDVLIVDTAGRLAVDETMMEEIARLHKVLNPRETLFVVDAMTGQDAANTARAFDEALPLTGVVLSKADGDARGGAALSVRSITGKPIKFLGIGEDLDGLESFHPDRIASRILGMGDVLSYLEEAEQKVDKGKAERLAKKIFRGSKFNLDDMRDQLQQFSAMGGVAGFKDMMPDLDPSTVKVKSMDDDQMKKQCVIIDSMTLHERRFPAVLDSSRKRRIAEGSGVQIHEVNLLLRKYRQLEKQMKRAGRKGNKILQRLEGAEAMSQGRRHR
ncbi:MAG: signal recognition particle protein [Gammaproteobacteria bacterium]|nr:signal recognition particle protein [Gammaproteobacteria bacterium]MYD81707.1 signal recognition particle protein [Gammaproteobacteria bacterium]